MEAIDFKKLLREERKRAKQKKQEQTSKETVKVSSDKANDENSIDRSDKSVEKTDARYHWGHPDGFLGFRQLSLTCLCENPRSISYSSTALEKRTLDVTKTNGNESLPDEPTISKPSFVNTITNDNNQISPEAALQNWLQHLPSGDSGLGEWKTMSYGKRRVCMFGDEETGGSLPPPLAEIAGELVNRGVFPSSLGKPPNHVLLNEYQPGQGILPHTDGPRYEHRTATLSLGSDVVIEFTKRLASNEIGSTEPTTISNKSSGGEHEAEKDEVDNVVSPIQILLESGSLLVFDDDAYLNYCHGIEMDVWRDVTTDNCLNATPGKIIPRGLRYSMTFRHKKSERKQTGQ